MTKRLPSRKSIRLKEYDYSQAGYYFITICSYKRNCILGEIPVGQGLCPCRLSEIGKIVNNEITELPNRFPHIEIANYVIMPNHVHLLLKINDFAKAWRHSQRQGQSPCPTGHAGPTVGGIIGTFKSITTKKANAYDQAHGRKIWQFRFHDHVIRNEAQLLHTWQYIDHNPLRWAEDCYFASPSPTP